MIKAVKIGEGPDARTVVTGRRPLGKGRSQRKRRKYARQTPQSSKWKR